MNRLEMRNLHCGYSTSLLSISSLTLEQGQHLLLYGPNGIGKSTFLKTVAGILKPLAGSVTFQGKSPHHAKAITRAIMYVPETIELPEFLTPVEYIHLVAEFYGEQPERKRIEDGLAFFDVEAFARLPIQRASQGQKRRIQLLAVYVLHRPLTLLDDPLIGIDANGKPYLDALARSLTQDGILLMTARESLSNFNALDIKTFAA